MNMDDSWFDGWYCNEATPDEKALFSRICDFEYLFDDMLLQKGTCTYNLTKIKHQIKGSDEWVEVAESLPEELEYFSYTFFHFKVEPLEGCYGMFSLPDQTLTVTPEGVKNGISILHEMIHLHEFVIDGQSMYFHDLIQWALYKDLKKKIPSLDDIITNHAFLFTGSNIYSAGGKHDILFLLKSLDLDIRMNYPLGTVFGYEKEDILKGYKYTKDIENA